MNIRVASAAVILAGLGVAASVSTASAFAVPGGSYARSCGRIQMNGPMLSAFCRRVNGSLAFSRIFVPRCGGSGVSNQNGHLVCGGYFR